MGLKLNCIFKNKISKIFYRNKLFIYKIMLSVNEIKRKNVT